MYSGIECQAAGRAAATVRHCKARESSARNRRAASLRYDESRRGRRGGTARCRGGSGDYLGGFRVFLRPRFPRAPRPIQACAGFDHIPSRPPAAELTGLKPPCNDRLSSDKGTPVERQGRKTTGLRDYLRQRGCQREIGEHRARSTPSPRASPTNPRDTKVTAAALRVLCTLFGETPCP